MSDLDLLSINPVRTLSMDAVQKANSGHPGTPMALAPLAYALFTRHMKHDPSDPHWPDRDRFVLSCGHASMLLYSALYLSGYDLTLDDLLPHEAGIRAQATAEQRFETQRSVLSDQSSGNTRFSRVARR